MLAILSDIHGNLIALESVVHDLQQFNINGIILLGDLIDYCMQSNEVVSYIRDSLETQVICSLWGNHENAILTSDFSRFSSQRGVDSAKHTASILSNDSIIFLKDHLIHDGTFSFTRNGKRFLAVHGSQNDVFWISIRPDNVNGDYRQYDVVLSGHSHHSHIFTKFYEADDPARRNLHAVLFINPGSVGQPRNQNANAQYALYDELTGTVSLRAVEYDIDAAKKLFDTSVDPFYRERLEKGI